MASKPLIINSSAKCFLLDTSQPFNEEKIKLLDEVISALYGKDASLVIEANQIISKLRKDENFWQSYDYILTHAHHVNTKFFALLALEDTINLKWNILPKNQREKLRKHITELIIKLASSNLAGSELQPFLNKGNSIIVAIMKKEYNKSWSEFISELCEISKTDQAICENTLNLFRILSEEVFEISKKRVPKARLQQLKSKLIIEFQKIYELCYFIMTAYVKSPDQVSQTLVMACLRTLLAYIKWVPLSYLYQSDLVGMLLALFDKPAFRSVCLSCFTEIASISIDNVEENSNFQYQEKLFEFLTGFLSKLDKIIPSKVNLLKEREKLLVNPITYESQLLILDALCRKVSLVLTEFLRTHLQWIERLAVNPDNSDIALVVQVIRSTIQHLINITNVGEDKIYKTCIEFWEQFTGRLRKKLSQSAPELVTQIQFEGESGTLFQLIYAPALIDLRKIISRKIEKPPEVSLIIKKTGEFEEAERNTESSSFYETCKDLMRSLTALDWIEMKTALIETLETQIDGTEWSTDNMNSLCWATGCIEGVLPEEEERGFVMLFLRTLLSLCEQKKEHEKKVIVASNIIYLSSKFPRVLKRNFNFLTILTKKLLEFILEPAPQLSIIACKTLVKLAEVCSSDFVERQIKTDIKSFTLLAEILQSLPKILEKLPNQQRFMIYTAIGFMLSAEGHVDQFHSYLEMCIGDTLQKWRSIVLEANQNTDILEDENTITDLTYMIQVLNSLAKSSKDAFFVYSVDITSEAFKLYEYYSRRISQESAAKNKLTLTQPKTKKMLQFRHEMVSLLQMQIERSENTEILIKVYIPKVKQAVEDFMAGAVECKEPLVLSLCTTIISKFGMKLSHDITTILRSAINAVLPFIKKDFSSHMELRIRLFELLLASLTHGFDAVIMQKAQEFEEIVDLLLWGVKHKHLAVFDCALEGLLKLIESFNRNIQLADKFYELFYFKIFDTIISVLTDGYHKSGFTKQAKILGLIFELVEKNSLGVSISKVASNSHTSNKEIVKHHAEEQFKKSFQTLSPQENTDFINELLKNSIEFDTFKSTLEDLVASLSEYSENFSELGSKADK